MADVDLKPGEIPVVGGDGKFYAVPEESVPEALRQGGRVATPAELQEHAYGGAGGEAAAAGLGAIETATAGQSTEIARALGHVVGGEEGRRSVEDQIRNYEQTNPIARMIGSAAPMALVPEAGATTPLVAGESLGARAINFAVPKFVRGVAETAHLEGSKGVSDDSLDHDFTAQSYIAHAATPEVLVGGLANVGLGAALHGAGKLFGSKAASALGEEGSLAFREGLTADAVTAAAQKAGRTSDEASQMYAGIQDLAQQAAAAPDRAGLFEQLSKAYSRAHANGSPEVESALNRAFREATDRFASSERVLDKTTREAVGHSDELFKGIAKMNELQFRLKDSTVAKLIDPGKFTQQVDSALTVSTEAKKALDEALMGVDIRGPEVKRLFETFGKLDNAIRDAVDINAKGLGTAASDRATREAAAKLYVALDDTKRVIGRSAKFGLEGKDGTAILSEHLYENFFRRTLEDESLWGSELGRMQARTNATFSEGFAASQAYTRMVGRVLETPGGRKLYSTENSRMRSLLSELEHAETPEDLTGLRAEVAQKVIDNTRARVTSMIETMDLAPADVAQLKKTLQSANALEKTIKRAHGEAAEARTLKELKNREMTSGASGIIGSVMGVFTSPAKMSEKLGRLSGIEQRVRKAIGGDARAFLTGERIMSSSRPVDREATVAAMKDIQKTASDPMIMKERVRKLMGDLADVSPGTASAVAVTSARLVSYLASEIPPPLPPRFLETEPRWADSDVDTFAKRLQTAMKPLTVFEQIQSGTLHSNDQAMLKKVYPDLYQEMKTSLLAEYKAAKEKGTLKALNPVEREMLSRLLDAPLDGTQQPKFSDRMQQAAMSDPNAQGAIGAQAQGGGRPKKVVSDLSGMKSESEKISGG